MRMLMTVRLPHEPFNAAVKDGTVGRKMEAILAETKPEAVYFTTKCGQRCAILVVDLKKPSMIPALAEPWFLTFNADVEFGIVMGPEELREAGLDKIGQKWG